MRLVGLAVISFVIFSSCTSRNSSINRVVDPYLDKSSINPNWEKGLLSPEWYYRMTVVDTAPDSKALSVGDGHWLHPETIRFEITENYLIGYRSQASVPGTDAESDNYKGAPVVAFKINSHFDISRNYDPMTSARGNLLQENKTDRSWYKRRFFKVDFSKNLAQELKRQDEGSWMWGSGNIQRDNSFAIGQNEPANPKRSRFEDGYFEITTRQGVKADIYQYYGLYGEPFQMDSAAPIIDIRFSFMRKPEKSNYQPLNYTDNLFDKFGFYRVAFSGQQKWDPKRGSLETNKNYNITRFNIWNEDGSPKPIIYYTSVSHPRSLLNASRRVESEWNKIFKELVFEMKKGQYADISKVPDMWILRENSCSLDNINRLLVGDLKKLVEETSSVTLEDIRTKLDHANDFTNGSSFTQNTQEEAKALDDLEKICASFEYYTQGTDYAFKYQRSGDLRYNLLNLINKYALTSWSGLGPMFADIQTGEIIQSQANINLWYLDKRTQQVIEMMDMMMGKIRFKELILGGDAQRYMTQKMSQIKREAEFLPDEFAMARMREHLKGQKKELVSEAEISSRLHEIDSTYLFPKIGGFEFEKNLDPISYFFEKQNRITQLAKGIADPPEFLDSLIVGIALQYKDEDPKKRFLKIRESVYTAVALHEVGHNKGLTHNMAGSADPLNYGSEFWKIQNLPPKVIDAIRVSKDKPELQKQLISCLKDSIAVWKVVLDTQDCLRQQELMYSSIMDYHASWNADLGGLGPYDKAAIFFGYGQMVQVFPRKNISGQASQKGLKRWLFLNDWKKIPQQLVGTSEQINERQWVGYDQNKILSNEVPYRFCLDSSGQEGPHCRAFDFGADMRGRAARNKTQYWNHYFLTHFSRDRIWNYRNDFQNIISQDLAIFEDFNHIMRWYGYYMLEDPEFKDSDAGKDYLAAVVSGLNHYSHVIGHPVSGEHVTTLDEQNILHPIDQVDSCVLENVTTTNDKNERIAVGDYTYSNIYLGDGRPFVVGLNNDYEDYHMNYVGSFHTKLYAGFFLSYPGSYFPKVDNLKDPRLFRMNWYRLFPDEVGDLFSKMILSEWSELGPLISPEGDLVHRDILDPETLKKPEYLNHKPVLPATADMLSYRSMYYAAALLSSPQSTEYNLLNSMQIEIQKQGHVISDEEPRFKYKNHFYWAKNTAKFPIAQNYLQKLDKLQKKIEDLEKCLSNAEFHAKNASCFCAKTTHEGECCSRSNPACLTIESLSCSDADIKTKIEQNKIDLENAVGFADDMSHLVKRYGSLR
ncbi:MAG: hypothetical protein WCK49_00905 [Myxococcaceae bacterium]